MDGWATLYNCHLLVGHPSQQVVNDNNKRTWSFSDVGLISLDFFPFLFSLDPTTTLIKRISNHIHPHTHLTVHSTLQKENLSTATKPTHPPNNPRPKKKMFSPTTLLFLALTTTTSSVVLAYPQAAAAANANIDPYFVCPAADMINTHCMGPKDCLYQDNNNCFGYIQCQPADDSYQTGIAYRMACPPTLMWNDNQKWCDYPEASTCTPKKMF